jgi:hypothetical protein
MVASVPSPAAAQPPPPIPQMEDVSPTLTNYLSQFALWCRRGFAAKMNANVAVDGILFQAYNPPAGAQPTVWTLQVNQQGNFVITQVALGSGAIGPRPP